MSIKKVRMLILIGITLITTIILGGCKQTSVKNTVAPSESTSKKEETGYLKKLDEKYSSYVESPVGLDITKKVDIVAICYTTWFNPIVGTSKNPVIYNNTEILKGNQEWGTPGTFHYWAEPALGYYRSDNKDVIRTHMTQLQDAGVDFIIIDNTNGDVSWKSSGYWRQMVSQPVTALLDTIVQMRSEGLKTPYVIFWTSANNVKGTAVIDLTYKEFYKDKEKYNDCWVYWEGKPFMLTTSIIEKPIENFTTRMMWGLNSNLATSEWSFLLEPNIATKDADGFNEQMCVCTALQRTGMTETSTAVGRYNGETFYKQWKRAFDARPKIVTLTWWNEWAAQRGVDANGQTTFCDNYNGPYSRDIEPMKGGHGDSYYKWMIEYIKAYKAHGTCPELINKDGFVY